MNLYVNYPKLNVFDGKSSWNIWPMTCGHTEGKKDNAAYEGFCLKRLSAICILDSSSKSLNNREVIIS